MQEDVRHLSELSADLGIGFDHHVFLLGTFIGVLWVLSAGIAIPIGGEAVVIPGYMVWCALLYAGIGSLLAWLIGLPLVALYMTKLVVDAIYFRDFPVVQTVLILSATIFVLINLLVDALYTVVDPRIRYR